jgi:hypothetical protein
MSAVSLAQHKTFRSSRGIKELAEAASVSASRARFEAGRSFDLDDDLEFCPNLLTEDDLQSISSSSSDRSSLSSGSPDASPLQRQVQPRQQVTPTFSLSSLSSPYVPLSLQQQQSQQPSKLQPSTPSSASSTRSRNAIPIVNPHTGMRVASPPPSLSPSRLPASYMMRHW